MWERWLVEPTKTSKIIAGISRKGAKSQRNSRKIFATWRLCEKFNRWAKWFHLAFFMTSTLSVGLLGTGIARQHARAYSLLPNARIRAICDVSTERAQSFVDEMNLTDVRLFSDYREMLSWNELDAVSLCLPNSLHAPVAIDCLGAGLHVLCEKPLAIDAANAQLIDEAARRSGKICMVSHVLRFRDDVRELKAKASEIGEIYYARTLARRLSGIPKWGGWFTQQKLSGGGPLIDTGVHLLDLAWWLAGCPVPISASGVTHAQFGPRKRGLGAGGAVDEAGSFDVEDLAAGFIRFANGFTLHFEASWAIHAASDARFCHIHGSDGALLWDDEPKFVDSSGTVSAVPMSAGDAWKSEIAHFVDCALNNKTPDPDASQGVVMMKMLDALYQSAKLGREVEIV